MFREVKLNTNSLVFLYATLSAVSFKLEDTTFCFLHVNLLQSVWVLENVMEEGNEKEKEIMEAVEDEPRVRYVNNLEGMSMQEEVDAWRREARVKLMREVHESLRMGRHKDLEISNQFDYFFCMGDPGLGIVRVTDEELSNYIESMDWEGLYRRGDEFLLFREQKIEMRRSFGAIKLRNGFHSQFAPPESDEDQIHGDSDEDDDEEEDEIDEEENETETEKEKEMEKTKEDSSYSDGGLALMNEGVLKFPPTATFREYEIENWGYDTKVLRNRLPLSFLILFFPRNDRDGTPVYSFLRFLSV